MAFVRSAKTATLLEAPHPEHAHSRLAHPSLEDLPEELPSGWEVKDNSRSTEHVSRKKAPISGGVRMPFMDWSSITNNSSVHMMTYMRICPFLRNL